ncbi:LysR family transcriptional regulator [Scandinavium sp. NPDC088450]|uniref:LysR family transcriptional regulator n=1 Tax=Scandinavium sp. NPDC088450 TaxID=3364514 RepID=UPI00384FFC9B
MNNISLVALKVVDAVIEHKSAVAAGLKLNISPSSISYILKKLREETQQTLFIRTRWGLVPDRYALELQKKYREIRMLSDSRREYIVTTYSPVELLIGMRIQSLALDDIFLRFQGMPDTPEERLRNIRHRSVDIDIGSRLPTDNAIVSFPYLMSGMCVMVSKHHRSVGESFTKSDWYDNRHITWLRGNDDLSETIANLDKNREVFESRVIACESTSLLAMSHLCAYSDNIMLLPEIFAPSLENIFPVNTFPMPWDIPLQFRCHIHYHRETGRNPNTERLIKLFDDLI